MNARIPVILGVIGLVAVGMYFYPGTQTSQNEVVNEVVTTGTVPVDSPESAAGATGGYVPFSSEKIAMAETGKVVLFFHASWCPSCRALNSDIEANADAVPEGVTILKTDYDKETELKKKYEVTTQHTLVQVDAEGNLIKKWSGGSKLENLLSEIQ